MFVPVEIERRRDGERQSERWLRWRLERRLLDLLLLRLESRLLALGRLGVLVLFKGDVDLPARGSARRAGSGVDPVYSECASAPEPGGLACASDEV